MKAKIKIEKEVDIRHVLINVWPRYIGDTDDDDIPTNFPLLNLTKQTWRAKVDIDTGVIEGWPKGDARKMDIKVCDAGEYTLLDNCGDVVIHIEGYVPNNLVPGDFGDYIELYIDENGKILNWPNPPDISDFLEYQE